MTAVSGGDPPGNHQALKEDVRELRAMLTAAEERLDLLMTARRRQLAASRYCPGDHS